jgi:hypothetical protein
MKKINEGELFGHLSSFFKAKGIELKEGAYTQRIEQGCSLLSNAINASQKGIKRAQAEAAKTIDEMRQVIHEKTAPKPPPASKAKPQAKRPAPKTPPRRTSRKGD